MRHKASDFAPVLSRRALLAGAAGGVLPLARAVTPVNDPLLSGLDLARLELAQVRDAAGRGDVAGARAAFALHLRQRTSPRWWSGELVRAISPADRDTADRALRHEFESVGIWHAFGPRIDWSYNPTNQPHSPDAYTPEWTWQLNRHRAWPALARAYAASGDARYARELTQQITDWIRDNPPPAGYRDEAATSRWRQIEAGIRMYDSWPQVLQIMAPHADAFPDDVLLAMVLCMVHHARFLLPHHGTANRECMEANGLYHVGVLLPEFREAARWRERGIGRLRRELDVEVYPDGAQYELTPGYHALSLNMFVSAMRLTRAAGYDLPRGYQSRLEKMYDLFPRLMMPDRLDPPFNDSPEMDALGMLAQGAALFPSRADWKFLTSNGKDGTPPSYTSCLFPYAGWAVMRSGWDRQALYLAMDAGPLGFSHFHEDKLSFVLDAYGARLIAEAGSYVYDASAMRQYVRSARGHNVVHVDDLEQVRWKALPETRVARSPMPIVWRSSPEFDYVCASYGRLPGEAWGNESLRDVVHTRQVLFVKPLYWIIADTLTPSDGAEHRYESTFHLHDRGVSVDPATRSATTRNVAGANLAILPLADNALDVRVVEGQTEPVLQGWLSLGQDKSGAVPRPVVCYTRRARGVTRFLYVFAPARTGASFPVTAVMPASADGLRADIVRADGPPDHVTMLADGSLSFDRGGVAPVVRFPAR